MKKLLPLFLLYLLVFSSCKKDSETGPELATLRTDSVGSVSLTSAKAYATLTTEGKSAVTEAGVAWGTNPNPTLNDHKVVASSHAIGSFSVDIPGLAEGTTYYIRGYATNGSGTAYGEQKPFTTRNTALPILTTTTVTDISRTSAKGGGTLINEGSSAVLERGVCWSTSPAPNLTSGNKRTMGSGLGNFSDSITGLLLSTKYYVRAYATNGQGTSYGNEVTFTTLGFYSAGGGVTDVDGNTYNTIILGTQEWMRENLKVTKYKNGVDASFSDYGDPGDADVYGRLYPWLSVTDAQGLCPTGWHVPSDDEWITLSNYLGGDTLVGGKLKSASALWTSPNVGTLDESGFSALPGGYDSGFPDGTVEKHLRAYFWTSTSSNADDAWGRDLRYNFKALVRDGFSKNYHSLSIRCVKD